MPWQSAKLGDSTSANQLGIIYNNGGDGIQKDFTKALQYFKQAAMGGNKYAQRNVGFYFVKGKGTTKNLIEAYAWLHLSANNGFSKAGQERDSLRKLMTTSQTRAALERYQELTRSIHNP